MLCRPFLSGSNTLPVKTVLLLNALLKNNNKINQLIVYLFDRRNSIGDICSIRSDSSDSHCLSFTTLFFFQTN